MANTMQNLNLQSEVTILEVEPTVEPTKSSLLVTDTSWKNVVKQYHQPSMWRSIWQLANTIIPFSFVLYLMYSCLSSNLWLTLLLAPIAAGLQVRIFIFFHDCGHGSFFKSRKLNRFVGIICGIICLTPYDDWWHVHAMHHATSGNLDRRAANQTYPVNLRHYIQEGYGMLTLTIAEYRQLKLRHRLFYRVYRHPLFLLVLIPSVQFLLFHRFSAAVCGKREQRSVLITNLALLVVSSLMIFTVGLWAFLLVTILVVVPATSTGVWLFYVQHQYEDAYWKSQDDWKYDAAALVGSSYYKLPIILKWFSGNIGFHHIHHLSPRIPNYYLAKCQKSYAAFQEVKPITLLSGLKSMNLGLWDEKQQKLVSFKAGRRVKQPFDLNS